MSSLIVLLPSSDVLAPGGWDVTPMPFALLGRRGDVMEVGHKGFDSLPKAGETVLVVAARDTLLVNAKLPPITGSRLRRLLPNVVEEHLIQDAQCCHVAIDPAKGSTDERCLAVIDRKWFASVLERFAQGGHRAVRAVPLIHCIPLSVRIEGSAKAEGTADTASESSEDDNAERIASVLIVRRSRLDGAVPAASDVDDEWIELALRQGALGFGMSVNAAQLDATLQELAHRRPLWIRSLTAEPAAVPSIEAASSRRSSPGVADAFPDEPFLQDVGFEEEGQTLHVVTLARLALACRFNLCQFELAGAGRGRFGEGGLKPWRLPLGFLVASLVVSIVALNVQWWRLRERRDALLTQMTQMVKTAFPGSPIVLDPHEQMALDLRRLKVTVGALRTDDFLALAASVAHALGPIPSTSIDEINYSGVSLELTFKAGTELDKDAFRHRLATSGLSAQEDDGKWAIRSAQSTAH